MEYIKANEGLHPGVMVPAEGWSVVISRVHNNPPLRWDVHAYNGAWGENCYPLYLTATLTKRSARAVARGFLAEKKRQETPLQVPGPDTEVITTHIRTTTDMGPH